jgi:transposase InsO family protein
VADYPEAQRKLSSLCGLLGVSRSWFYARTRERALDPVDVQLRADIEAIVLEHSGYGYRRVSAQLRRDGWCVNHKRVLRVLREECLLCRLKRRFVPTTDSKHAFAVYPNLLREQTLSGFNQAWVADITYIRLPRRFCFLAAVLDAYSRRCVGYKLSLDIDTALTLAALEMALVDRHPGPGLIHHSDRGVQYASHAYIERLESVGARVSMSAKGNPYDNAKAESFFRTLKHEEVYLSDYEDYADALRGIEHFIADVYNTKRLHSSLGYLPPAEFEASVCSVGTRPSI